MTTIKQTPKEKPPKKQPNKLLLFSGIAFQMSAIIFVGAFIGIKLDEKYPNEHHLYTTLFSLVFVIISLYLVIRQVIKFSNKENE